MEDQRIFDQQVIVPLLTRYIRGEELTSLELKTIEIWVDRSEANRAVYLELCDNERLAKNLVDFDAAQSATEDGLIKLHRLLKKRQSHYKRVVIWTAAAAVLLFFSLTLLLYRYYQSRNTPDETVKMATADIDPGKDQATLTFGDGKTINLDGKSVKTNSDGITMLDDKAIVESSAQFAVLSTPRKGQYKIVLSDGTRVWLNAESRLKYPTRFTGRERLVELEGEGYFEVLHDKKKPFIVSSRGQRVKVLGTKFNISSYENEAAMLTTLVSGSVELTNSQNSTPVLLKPGQQGKLLSLSSIFFVENVDTEVFTAWTSNDFHFDGTPLKEVFKQLERWYDIDVDYKKVPNVKVHGTISREKKLSTVLYTLGQITDLQFKLTGRRIEVDNN